jgi:hypothetical protein
MLAAKQRQQQQPQAQMMAAIRPAAGGYIQLPNGQLVPAAGLIPMQGGGLAMLQATPAAAAPQPPAVDPLAVANALFTAGGQPNTIVWYVRTDGPDSGEGQQSSSVQGPFDPQVRGWIRLIALLFVWHASKHCLQCCSCKDPESLGCYRRLCSSYVLHGCWPPEMFVTG